MPKDSGSRRRFSSALGATLLLGSCTSLQSIRLPTDDRDGDLISDALEDQLLERFRPFYRFSTDGGEEDQKPADALWYVRHSSLLSSGDKDDGSAVLYPLGVLDTAPDALLTKTPGNPEDPTHTYCTNVYLSPNGPSSGKSLSDGESWDEIETKRNVGLYGHVTRSGTDLSTIQIQYWQFYPYNDAHHDQVADHEGDWEMVEVDVLVPDQKIESTVLLSVTHFIHGRAITGFPGGPQFRTDDIGLVAVSGHDTLDDLQLDSPFGPLAAFGAHLELFCDNGDRAQCTHPVVYIEHGTHASWPTRNWQWTAAPKHGGDSIHRFLTATPPNLGEVGAPRPLTPGANLITQFTGRWGAFSRSLPGLVDTSNPRGPAMHRAWSWGFASGPAPSCLE